MSPLTFPASLRAFEMFSSAIKKTVVGYTAVFKATIAVLWTVSKIRQVLFLILVKSFKEDARCFGIFGIFSGHFFRREDSTNSIYYLDLETPRSHA